MSHKTRAFANELTKQLTEQGKIVEAGWLSYRLLVVPGNASQVQIDETRKAFYAGVLHLFQSMNFVLGMDDGTEPNEADLKVMDNINSELQEFYKTIEAQIARRPDGN